MTSLANEYRKLIKYCESPEYDFKIFKTMHDNYAKSFGRLGQDDQGQVCEDIRLDHFWGPAVEEVVKKRKNL